MNIALDNRAIPFSGIGVYIRALAKEYAEQGHEVHLYEDHVVVSRDSFVDKYVHFAQRKFREIVGMRKWLGETGAEIYHATANTDVPLSSSVPVVVTIHDIIPHILPDQYFSNALERLHYELYIRMSIRRAQHIITISEFSRQELLRVFQVPKERTTVVYNGYNTAFRKLHDEVALASVRKKYHLDEKYLLTIGGSEYRKNNRRLIEVYLENLAEKCQLVVVGSAWRGSDLSKEFADSRIKFLSNIPIEDLVAIYNMAELFVFPSFYEGFGIPAMEAMACGVPVVSSNATSLPEVCGSAAIYFDPYDKADMAREIGAVLSDEDLRQRLIVAGTERAKKFSWKKCAEQTYAVYEHVLGQWRYCERVHAK